MSEFGKLSKYETCRLIDFDQTEIRQGLLPGSHILVVSGMKPLLNMKVDLSPYLYVNRPDYWRIEVVGSLSGTGRPEIGTYSISLPLEGITGTIGIEIVGANWSEKRQIPPLHKVELAGHLHEVQNGYRLENIVLEVDLSAVQNPKEAVGQKVVVDGFFQQKHLVNRGDVWVFKVKKFKPMQVP